MEWLSRGQLAKAAGVGIEAVRFYETKGLIPVPKRTESGYRQYAASDVTRIRFVKRAQELGFSLREIKELLALNANSRTTCADIQKKADRKLLEVEAKIRDLRRMRQSLKELSESCGEGKRAAAECRILECFETGWRC